MKLKKYQLCPIHRTFLCECRGHVRARKLGSKWETVRPGVRRIRDQFADHADGYRYKLSKGEMQKVLLRKVAEQGGKCAIGGETFTTIAEVVPDHRNPRGMNGARRDDRPENIQAACWMHNNEKGSKRIL